MGGHDWTFCPISAAKEGRGRGRETPFFSRYGREFFFGVNIGDLKGGYRCQTQNSLIWLRVGGGGTWLAWKLR